MVWFHYCLPLELVESTRVSVYLPIQSIKFHEVTSMVTPGFSLSSHLTQLPTMYSEVICTFSVPQL